MTRGDGIETITANYVAESGAGALVLPPNEGAFRLIYIAPILASIGGLGVIAVALRRWKRRDAKVARATTASGAPAERDEYDAKLDEELRKLDG